MVGIDDDIHDDTAEGTQDEVKEAKHPWNFDLTGDIIRGSKGRSSNNNGNGKSKGKSKNKDDVTTTRPKKYVRKYTFNGKGPLFETVIIQGLPRFVSYAKTNGDNSLQLQTFKFIDGTELGLDYDLYPAETSNSHNPITYSFGSIDEIKEYIERAKQETFGSLFSKVRTVFGKYVNVEDHYATVLSADIIYSYFQDKFGLTHYNIFVGDNGSGKNSALLMFKHLGYRVFYVVGASAPNYYTFLGDIEECQGCIAEDESEDIAYDRDKNKVMKTGYASGATVPKVDTNSLSGRKQDSWLTYCHKWFAMEELPDYKKIKGVMDRSFVYNFVVGNVEYNIKDIAAAIQSGDSEHIALYDEIVDLHKLLFAFRLLHWKDNIPDIKLNVIHRNAELTKAMLRLFSYRSDASKALDEIRLALSKFILGRNESKKNSIESKLLDAVNNFVNVGKAIENIEDGKIVYFLYNDQIRTELRAIMDGIDIPGKTEAFYSPDYGAITYKRITALYRSKLKAESVSLWDSLEGRTKRGLAFKKDVLDQLGLYYNVPDKIEILQHTQHTQHTQITHLEGRQEANDNTSHEQNTDNAEENPIKYTDTDMEDVKITSGNDVVGPHIPPESVISVRSVRSVRNWTCNYCSFEDENERNYRNHIVNRHHGKSGNPDKNGRELSA